MAKRKTKKKKQQQSRASVGFLSVVMLVIFWLLLSVAFELPFLDFVKDEGDKTQDLIQVTATPTATPGQINPSATPTYSDPTATPDPQATATPTATQAPGDIIQTEQLYLFAYRDGETVYSETKAYTYTGTLDKQDAARTAINSLPLLLNYDVKFNTIILDENGLHVDISSSGAPFVKDCYYMQTGVFAAEYSTYDQQVYGILDSICYTAKSILGANTAVYFTMDGGVLDFGGQLIMDTVFSTEIPYLGYTYYHEHYDPQLDVYSIAMSAGVSLSFASDTKYYFRGTIGSREVDVTLTAMLESDMVIIKLMSVEGVPMYVLDVDSNKVMVSDPSDTTVKITLYQDANQNILGEWQTISGGNTVIDKVDLEFMRYELNQ